MPAPALEEMPVRFKAYDDDDELYYEGRVSGDDESVWAAYTWMVNDTGVTYLKIKEPDRNSWELYP